MALDGSLYEAPVALIGKQITLLYHPNDSSRIEALHDSQSYGMLRTVNLNANCRAHRHGGTLTLESEPRPLSSGKLPFNERKGDSYERPPLSFLLWLPTRTLHP